MSAGGDKLCYSNPIILKLAPATHCHYTLPGVFTFDATFKGGWRALPPGTISTGTIGNHFPIQINGNTSAAARGYLAEGPMHQSRAYEGRTRKLAAVMTPPRDLVFLQSGSNKLSVGFLPTL